MTDRKPWPSGDSEKTMFDYRISCNLMTQSCNGKGHGWDEFGTGILG